MDNVNSFVLATTLIVTF